MRPGGRIAPDEAAAVGLVRLLTAEITAARQAVEHPGDGAAGAVVHGVRKRLKTARTLVRILKPLLGPAAAVLAAELKSAARAFAPARDAAVLAQTARALQVPDGPARRLLAQLAAEADARAAHAEASPATVAAVATHLRAAQDILTAEPLGPARVGRRVARLYTKMRHARSAAKDTPADEHFHTWRKRVKDRAAVGRAFADQWPEREPAPLKRLDRLADLLGRHHDLAVLAEHLPAAGADAAAVRRAIRKRQKRLERRALDMSRRTVSVKPRRVRAAWQGV